MRAEPAIAGQPLAVMAGKHPLLAVCTANALAREAGVQLGMSKQQAEQFSGVELRQRCEALEEEGHAAILRCAFEISPRVEDTATEAVVLDLSGLAMLMGAEARIAQNLRKRLAEGGFEAQIAVASNPDAAICAARGFCGTTVIAEGAEAKTLAGLAIGQLSPGEEIQEIFTGWGITTFGELAALPEIPLSERLGQEGLRLQRLARGAVKRLLVPTELPLRFEETRELEDAIELLEPLAFVLGDLLHRICEQLAGHALAAHQLQLCLELRDKTLHERTLRLPVPMRDGDLLLKLMRLELSAHPPSAAVTKVTIRAEPASPKHTQNGLFGAASPEPEKLELILARITHIVGEGNAGSPELLDTHRQQAFRMVRFRPAAPRSKRVAQESNQRAARMALRAFRPPKKTRVWSRDGVPRTLCCGRMRAQVVAAAGPWHSSGDWWEQRPWAHEEWDVALEQGLFRIYHDLVDGGWYMEGSYD